MQPKRKAGYIVSGILAVLIISTIIIYNSLVNKEEKVNKQWSEVQNTYQRRLDLVPNLVNVVKGVSEFEQETLKKIAEARSKALSGLSNNELTADNYNSQTRLQDSLAAATNRLIVVIEKYPDLKGTQAYVGLQVQLEGTERRIKVARNDFNEAIAIYNNKVRSFPANIVAGLFGFRKKDGFEADAGSNKAVEIKL
jgi:LemA protein